MYDEIEEGQDLDGEVPEFTEKDLIAIPTQEENDFVVKSKPPVRKKSQAIDEKVNPYTNPNLDAELSMTIGKNKASRTKIDAQKFLIDKKND